MPDVRCFLVVPTDRIRRALRVYDGARKCTGPLGYCNAQVPLDEIVDDDGAALSWPRDDARWPKACDACGVLFDAEARHQLWRDPIYRADDGREWPLRELPAGAMYDATWWWRGEERGPGPDGRCLAIRLPDGQDWMPDLPARDGAPWTRTGDVPNVTCTPSILTPSYHGWLRAGVLSPC